MVSAPQKCFMQQIESIKICSQGKKGIIYVLQQDTLQGLGAVFFREESRSRVTVTMNNEVMNPSLPTHLLPSHLIQNLKFLK